MFLVARKLLFTMRQNRQFEGSACLCWAFCSRKCGGRNLRKQSLIFPRSSYIIFPPFSFFFFLPVKAWIVASEILILLTALSERPVRRLVL